MLSAVYERFTLLDISSNWSISQRPMHTHNSRFFSSKCEKVIVNIMCADENDNNEEQFHKTQSEGGVTKSMTIRNETGGEFRKVKWLNN